MPRSTAASPTKVWDVLKDNYPDNNAQKVHKPGTAAAANAVCWSCKSTDVMMDWAYLWRQGGRRSVQPFFESG